MGVSYPPPRDIDAGGVASSAAAAGFSRGVLEAAKPSRKAAARCDADPCPMESVERPGVAVFEKDDHAVICQFLSGLFQPTLARRAYFWFIFWAFPRLLVPVPSHFDRR
jgi:hypothetical protein